VHFRDFCRLVEAFGFELLRTQGSHRAFSHPGIPELVNVQPQRNGDAKPVQIRQFLDLIDRYNLSMEA
jgi:predicted RNA binding protein YcfA (HicA-like mRNA interferase family)